MNLPDQDGFSVLEKVREGSQLPVIMLTVRASEPERVKGLEMGADDYMAKPFSPFELVARASAVLRRSGARGFGPPSGVLQAGAISLNPDTAEVFVDEERVKLSPTEFKILSLLVENAGKVVTPDILIKQIWGIDRTSGDTHLIKLHIQHLRRKLGDTGVNPRFVMNVRGFGYKVPA